MLLLGLTGSIATGKSTVSNILRSAPYNLPIIDADVLAREVVEPGTPGYAAIVRHFGPTTPDLLLPADDPLSRGTHDAPQEMGPNGKGRPLNRPALGRAVFGGGVDTVEARKVLNGIVHPAVRRAMWKQVLYYYMTGHWAVVLDIPLLFEGPLHYSCGTALVVAVKDPAIQMARLRARDAHLSEEDAKNRVLSQGDVREKAERALARGAGRGVVVWNDGEREELKKGVDKVMEELRSRSPWWWTTLCLICPPVGITSGGWALLRNWMIDRAWVKEKTAEKAKL
ncbi:CoaE-domain-containing protein [Microthyrium microscopicum]|uniref:CoaE-domain-containing protein n=1 Tax=Microthyrium microscopicum TaxID=703497 RepID=A0A6A6URE8_9PEZI|nr:CoaE-domain-containing protein [Microthyrium microscopicum]